MGAYMSAQGQAFVLIIRRYLYSGYKNRLSDQMQPGFALAQML
ncbi:MAG: hypothetical protein ACI4RP_01130 [Acutalibacteraceae bacterium]